MKKLMRIKKSEKGFTLFELIIILTISAILASMLVTFMGTAVMKSADQINQVKNMATAEAKMERINANYIAYSTSTTGTPNWSTFISTYCSTADTCQKLSGCTICITGYDTYEAVITVGNQKLVNYFIQ